MIVSLATGDFVRLGDDYDGDTGVAGALYRFLGAGASVDLGAEDFGDASRWVEVGSVYQWMGTAQSVDLGTTDYTDFELWKKLTPTDLISGSVGYVLLNEIGVALKREGLIGQRPRATTA